MLVLVLGGRRLVLGGCRFGPRRSLFWSSGVAVLVLGGVDSIHASFSGIHTFAVSTSWSSEVLEWDMSHFS